MDWNKKIYPIDILKAIFKPFKPFMSYIRSKFDSFLRGWTNVVDIKWKGDHEDKFVDLDRDILTKEDDDYVREYAREARRLFGRTLMPEKSSIRNEYDIWDTRRMENIPKLANKNLDKLKGE